MRNLHTEFVYRKIQTPNPILAHFVRFAFRMICKRHRVQFVYDEQYLKMKDQQMLILCQHRSRNDYIYAVAGLHKLNVHLMCGYQNVFQPIIYSLFKRLGVIAKMLYQPDVRATVQLFQGAKLGNSLLLFPEGIQSTSGSTHPINPATMKLLLKLKLPVALVTLKGAYFTRTRYSGDRKKGRITVTFRKLFDTEDFDRYSREELYAQLLEQFRYNEFEEHRDCQIPFRGKLPNIAGLDNIIYRCPQCGAEYRFLVEGTQMHCTQCAFAVSMDAFYNIHPVSGTLPFDTVDTWYKWQRWILSREVQDDAFVLSAKVKIGRINTKKLTANYSIVYCGEGTLTLTNRGLTYHGTQDGKPAELVFQPKQVYSLSPSLSYDLDLYYDGQYYNFKLLEREKQIAKWMLAAEEIHNLYDPAWRAASSEVYRYE